MTKEKKYCSCGNVIPDRKNSTIKAVKCPSCTYAELSKKKRTSAPNKKYNGLKRLKTKNTIDKRLDTAWSEMVKIMAYRQCEVCGNKKSLNSHHIISRARKSLRWDLNNGVCLCVNHHIGPKSAHKDPVWFYEWLLENRGKQFIDDLKSKSNGIGKFSQFEKEILLKELNDKIKYYKNLR